MPDSFLPTQQLVNSLFSVLVQFDEWFQATVLEFLLLYDPTEEEVLGALVPQNLN